MPEVTEGKTGPLFNLDGTDGEPNSLQAALRKGPVLAVFFKVACPTCQYTLPFIERLYRQFADKDIQIWGISQDDAGASRRFAKEYNLTFPILVDQNHYATSRQYGVKYVPTMFLIKPDGQVETRSEGFSKVDLLDIQKSLAHHLSAEPGEFFRPDEKVPEHKPG
jgi:peroxiredoxin